MNQCSVQPPPCLSHLRLYTASDPDAINLRNSSCWRCEAFCARCNAEFSPPGPGTTGGATKLEPLSECLAGPAVTPALGNASSAAAACCEDGDVSGAVAPPPKLLLLPLLLRGRGKRDGGGSDRDNDSDDGADTSVGTGARAAG
jgi:hypothetical protein